MRTCWRICLRTRSGICLRACIRDGPSMLELVKHVSKHVRTDVRNGARKHVRKHVRTNVFAYMFVKQICNLEISIVRDLHVYVYI